MPRNRHELREELASRRAQFEERNARVTERAGRNLVFAAATGLTFAAIFLVALFAWEPLMLVLGALLAVLGLIEISGAMRRAGLRVSRVAATISGIIITGSAWFFGAEGLIYGLLASGVVLTLWRLCESLVPQWAAPWRSLIIDLFAGLFCLVYVPFSVGVALVLLRDAERGEWWIFSTVLVVVCVDIGAYVAGITLGRHKMAPRVSPNKTWEGFAGAAITAVLAAVIAAVFLFAQSWWVGVIFGGVILVLATVGDLTESLIKRNLGIKDMSSWLPGHGGLLDRLDSVLPSLLGAYMVALVVGAIG